MENQKNNSSDLILDNFKNSESPIYRIMHIRNATFFGGPIVGTYLIAANFKEMGDERKTSLTWFIGIGVLLLTISIGFLVSEIKHFPSILIPLLISQLAGYLAKRYQEDYIEKHSSSNGEFYSGWRVFGITLIGLLINIAIIFAIVFLIDPEF